MCFKKSHSELWFQRCLGCCRLTMTARSEDNIQKLVAGGSEAIIQQRDTDSTENEQETFLVVFSFSKYNEGWITAEELKLLPTHLLGKVQKKYFYFYFMIFQIFPIWQVTVSTRRFWRWSRQWTRTGTAVRSKLQFHVMMGAPPLISTTKAEMDTISPPENKTLPLLPNIRSVSCTISILSFCFKICFLLGPYVGAQTGPVPRRWTIRISPL